MDEQEKKPTARQKLKEIRYALENEKAWRKEAKEAIDIHHGKRRFRDTSDKPTFNILWANVDTKRQAIYSNLPKPDIRKRWKKRDTVGNAVSEMMERSINYLLDCKGAHEKFIDSVIDMLLPGRAIIRVKYKSDVETVEDGEEAYETVGSQEVSFKTWNWEDFCHGPGKKWEEVQWECFTHRLSKDDVKERWKEFADKINYDTISVDGEKSQNEDEVYKEATIYEMWHKKDKKVYWMAKDFADSFLEVQDDPMELNGFFPNCAPLYAIESTDTLTPQTEYSKYKILAEELETVSFRLNMIAKAIRVRGIYDSSISEIEKVLASGDNEMVPADNVIKLLERGGLEKAIWMLPINDLVQTRQILGQQRQDLLAQIYEITGISDILRGNTNPHETASAQELKSSWGSMRLEKQKQAVQGFIRDTIRIVVELIAENYTRENLTAMTGMAFPTEADKQQAQAQMQMAEQTQQQPPQGLEEILNKPTWEQIEEVMQSDMLRNYRVDIETDSTIRVDEDKDKEDAGFLMKAIADFSATGAQAVQAGMMTPEAATELLKSMIQKFRLGRDVVDAFSAPPPQQGPSPEEIKAQQEQQKMQMEQQKAQMDMQMQQQKTQMDIQAQQQKLQTEQQMMQLEARLKQQEAQLKQMLSQMEMQQASAEHQLEMESLERKEKVDQAKHTRDMQIAKQKPNNR